MRSFLILVWPFVGLLAACGATVPQESTPLAAQAAATQTVVSLNLQVSHSFVQGPEDSVKVTQFQTLACDVGDAPGSVPWLNGGFPTLGQEVFIPKAVGTALPNDTKHQGFFRCQRPLASVENGPIAIFIGTAETARQARRATPFRFARSTPGREVQVLILP